MSEIKEFWSVKHLYKTPEELLSKITEFYTSDFIENFSKWKSNIDELNKEIKSQLFADGFPEKHWKDMEYDVFCKEIINAITEWIKVNSDIDAHDIILILQKITNNYTAELLKIWQANMFNLEALLESVKKVIVFQHNAKQ